MEALDTKPRIMISLESRNLLTRVHKRIQILKQKNALISLRSGL